MHKNRGQCYLALESRPSSPLAEGYQSQLEIHLGAISFLPGRDQIEPTCLESYD